MASITFYYFWENSGDTYCWQNVPTFIKNKLIAINQSDFKREDYCISQFLSVLKIFINHLMKSVRSEALIYREHLIRSGTKVLFSNKDNGISGNLLKVLPDILKDRKQKVALNGQVSNWSNVTKGVPKGSILGPLSPALMV